MVHDGNAILFTNIADRSLQGRFCRHELPTGDRCPCAESVDVHLLPRHPHADLFTRDHHEVGALESSISTRIGENVVVCDRNEGVSVRLVPADDFGWRSITVARVGVSVKIAALEPRNIEEVGESWPNAWRWIVLAGAASKDEPKEERLKRVRPHVGEEPTSPCWARLV